MNRRTFLNLLAAAAPALAVDPERLLWTPRTVITVPAMPLMFKGRMFTADEYMHTMRVYFTPQFWIEQENAMFKVMTDNPKKMGTIG